MNDGNILETLNIAILERGEKIERHQCALLAHSTLRMYQSDAIEAATEVAEVADEV